MRLALGTQEVHQPRLEPISRSGNTVRFNQSKTLITELRRTVAAASESKELTYLSSKKQQGTNMINAQSLRGRYPYRLAPLPLRGGVAGGSEIYV